MTTLYSHLTRVPAIPGVVSTSKPRERHEPTIDLATQPTNQLSEAPNLPYPCPALLLCPTCAFVVQVALVILRPLPVQNHPTFFALPLTTSTGIKAWSENNGNFFAGDIPYRGGVLKIWWRFDVGAGRGVALRRKSLGARLPPSGWT
ncbi:hypothetical protein JTB14_004319 [Gonioctena quinquepunctata]|nr:hypothetical protein JTB14_004319 [Gonioctena quinquepunctata]